MKLILKFLTFASASLSVITLAVEDQEFSCMGRGICKGEFGIDGICYYDGPPLTLQNEIIPDYNTSILEWMEEYCPELITGPSPKVCCDKEVFVVMLEQLELVKTFGFGRCSSCLQNFFKNACHSTCSPYQGKVGDVTKKTDYGYGLVIEEITAYVPEHLAYGLYDSCKDIQGLIPGTFIFDYGACGKWGRKSCTAERFFEFVGTSIKEGGYGPFAIITVLLTDFSDKIPKHKTVIHPYELDVYKCSESPGPAFGPCSCVDCPDACNVVQSKIPEFEQEAKRFVLFNFDGFVMLFCLVFLLLGSTLTIIYICTRFKFEKENLISRQEDSQNGKHVKNGNRNDIIWNGINYYDVKSISFTFENFTQLIFRKWANFVCLHPLPIFTTSLLSSAILSLGIYFNFKVTTDPVDLWTSPSSQAHQHMNYFNKHFGPIFRIEQLILTPVNKEPFYSKIKTEHKYVNLTWGPALRKSFLLSALELLKKIEKIEAYDSNTTITLREICVSPLKPVISECAIQSIFGIFGNNAASFDSEENYLTHFYTCSRSRLLQECFAPYGGPLQSIELVLGGYEKENFETAEALIISIPIENYYNNDKNEKAMLWENAFIDVMKNFNHPEMNITFASQRSIEDEIERQSHADIPLVVLGYITIMCYVAMTLGQIKSVGTFFADSKFTLGFFGVLIVFLSATAALGLFCFLDIPATLIITEVIPFLVLAVGVDNIFILVQAFQRDEERPSETINDKISRVVGETAPSILLSTLSMSSCFFIGSISEMPAVKNFALYAGVALILNLFLQMTSFLSLFVWDTKRQLDNELDNDFHTKAIKCNSEHTNNDGIIYNIFKKNYAPFIMKNGVRYTVLMSFLAWLCSSLAVIPKIDLGLELDLSVPKDSYLSGYFADIKKYLTVGYPVSFVITKGFNYSDVNAQKLVCATFSFCDKDSILMQLHSMTKVKNNSYIAIPPTSWLDSYFEFLQSSSCCFTYKQNGTFCPSMTGTKHRDLCSSCKSSSLSDLSEKEFNRRVEFFLNDVPWEKCAKGGKALFKSSVEIIHDKVDPQIGATHFTAYHTHFKTSKDHYEALKRAREISKNLTAKLSTHNSKVEVFPYCFMHVFYEQYLTMWSNTMHNIGLCLLTIFIASFLLFGFDVISALIVVVTVAMIIADVMGLMYWWDISLNALSLVNIIVAAGLSVEFCCHLVRTFALSNQTTRVLKAQEALYQTGTSVLSGISLTDCGILFLAFAKSQVLQVFYFRMYLGIIVIGTLHGLIFLPTLLSLVGPHRTLKPKVEAILQYKEQSERETCI